MANVNSGQIENAISQIESTFQKMELMVGELNAAKNACLGSGWDDEKAREFASIIRDVYMSLKDVVPGLRQNGKALQSLLVELENYNRI